jgi:peptidyl-prolyl cis-trans isomerase SurA
MKTKVVVTLCFAGIAGAAWAADAVKPEAKDVRVVEQIVAKVNNDIITRGELDRTRRLLQTELTRQRATPDQIQRAMRSADSNLLRDRIDDLLLVQKAKDLEVKVDTDVSKYIADIQRDSGITDPDQFQQYIRDRASMSYEDFKEQAKDGMLKQEVIRHEVYGRVNVSQAEAQQYYDEHKDEFVREEQVILREVFLSTEGKTPEQIAAIEKKAKDLSARARKGERFGDLARDNSDSESAKEEGRLPPFKRGMLKKELEDLMFKESRGYVTDPIKNPNGFLILRIEEHYQAGLQPFDAVQNEVTNKLYPLKAEPKIREYLTKLRQEAYLEIREGYTDSGAAPGKDTAWKDPAKLVPATTTKLEVAKRMGRKRLLWLVPIPGTRPSSGQETN